MSDQGRDKDRTRPDNDRPGLTRTDQDSPGRTMPDKDGHDQERERGREREIGRGQRERGKMGGQRFPCLDRETNNPNE